MFCLYQLRVHSDFPLPADIAPGGSGNADFVLSRGTPPRPFEPRPESRLYLADGGGPDGWGRIELHRDKHYYCLRVAGIAEFFFSGGPHVACFPVSEATSDLIGLLFCGPLAALLLELRGIICLHASAVLFGDHAVGFIGLSGCGKSSLAAFCLSRGSLLLTDDVLPVDLNGSRCLGVPGCGRIKLSRDVAHALLPFVDAWQPTYSGSDKYLVSADQGGWGAAREPAALRAVYVLERSGHTGQFPEIRPLSPAAGLTELLRHSFCARASGVLGIEEQRLSLLAELARRLPVRRLCYQDGLEHLEEVHAAISVDIAS